MLLNALQANIDQDAYRDIALINAAAALVIADKAASLKEGVALGAAALDQGKVAALLEQVVQASNEVVA